MSRAIPYISSETMILQYVYLDGTKEFKVHNVHRVIADGDERIFSILKIR